MTAQVPDRGQVNALEPSVGDQIRLGQAISLIERAGLDDLRRLAREMATAVFVVHPAAVRHLAQEAARNLRVGPAEQFLGIAESLSNAKPPAE